MTQEDIATAERKTLSVRAGSSRKLLARKALEKGTPASAPDALEDSFPPQERHQEPQSCSASAPAAALAQPPRCRPIGRARTRLAYRAFSQGAGQPGTSGAARTWPGRGFSPA